MAEFFVPMLAKTAPVGDLNTFCEDDVFGGQQKVDGDRMIVYAVDGRVEFRTRNDYSATGVTRALDKAFKAIAGNFVFDGEYLDGVFYPFDILWGGTDDLRPEPFIERYTHLSTILEAWDPPGCIKLLPLATTHLAKAELALEILSRGAEGLVFKKLDSAYVGHRTRRSDAWRKVKFRKDDIDCVVTGKRRDDHDNLVLSVYRDGQLVEVGEVSAQTGDGKRVEIGDVVAVKYLYASNDNRLVQPTVPRIRRDKDPEQCDWAQLQYTDRTVLLDVI